MNSDYILDVLETVKFVFCLQIHALAECIMSSKFCILYSAPAASCSIQNFSFRSCVYTKLYIQLVCVFVNKTLTTVSNP